MNKRIRKIALLSLLGFILGTGVAWLQVQQENNGGYEMAKIEPAAGPGTSGAEIGGSFSLTDHNGTPVTESNYRDSYKLIFFGFTYCPEICPTELQKMTKVLNALGPDADPIQPLFITTDPERDTPETMQAYVEMFHPRLVGLTGTPEQIKNVQHKYKVYAAKVESKELSDYTMDHSSFTFLMSPDDRLLALFSSQDSAQDIEAEIRSVLQSQ